MREDRRGLLLSLMLGAGRALAPAARWLGADRNAYRAILCVDLRLDLRRSGRGNESKFGGLSASCVMNAIFGALIGLVIVLTGEDPVLSLHLITAVGFVFVLLSLLGDFMHVLFDTASHAVLAARPVSERTLFVTRLAHILIYLAVVTGSAAIGPLLGGCIAFGPWPFAPVALIGFVSIGLVAALGAVLVFAVAMRSMPAERFKDFVVWLQVIVTVVVFGGFQVLINLVDQTDAVAALSRYRWLHVVVPIAHPGSLYALVDGSADTPLAIAGLLCVALPLAMVVLVARFAHTGFAAKLSEMAVASGDSRAAGLGSVLTRSVTGRLTRLVTRPGAERAGFEFFRRLSRRERQFKLRVYTMVAMSLVMGAVMTWRLADRDLAMLTSGIYLLGFYTPAMLVHTRYSDSWSAAWLFDALPLEYPERFVVGAMKAFVAAFALPVLMLFAAVTLAVGGSAIVLDTLLALGAALALTLSCVAVFGARMPFCEQFQQSRVASATSIVWLMMIPLVGAILIHVLLRPYSVLFATLTALVWIANVVLVARMPAMIRARVRRSAHSRRRGDGLD